MLDFSDKVLRPGTETMGFLYYISEEYPRDPMPLDPSYYSWDNGKITLNAAYADSVMVVFANSELQEYPMTTRKFMVKPASEYGRDNVAASMRFSSTVTDISRRVPAHSVSISVTAIPSALPQHAQHYPPRPT